MKTRLKINGFIMSSVILLVAIFPAVFFRKETVSYFDEVAEAFGVAFILLGQIFRASARGYKAEYSQRGNFLIQDGPYSLVRNPMYLGILFIGLGIVLMLFKWWVTGVFLLVFTTRYIMLIFKEEKKLLLTFPDDYPDYKRRVPRLMPSAVTLLEKDIRDYLPLKLSWLRKETGSILAVLLGTLFVESWEDIRNGGIRAYLKEIIAILAIIILFVFLIIYLGKRSNSLKRDVPSKS